jgi:hypothetical protein
MRWRRFTVANKLPPARNGSRPGRSITPLSTSFVREAVVPERKLVTEALKRGIGCRDGRGRETGGAGTSADPKSGCGRQMATTKEMLALESRLIDFARQGRGAVPAARRSGAAMLAATGSTTGKRRPSAMSLARVTG